MWCANCKEIQDSVPLSQSIDPMCFSSHRKLFIIIKPQKFDVPQIRHVSKLAIQKKYSLSNHLFSIANFLLIRRPVDADVGLETVVCNAVRFNMARIVETPVA